MPDQSVDCVLLLDVLEHLEWPERCLRQAHRVLKPDGLLFVNVPNHFTMTGTFAHLARSRWCDCRRLFSPVTRLELSAHPLLQPRQHPGAGETLRLCGGVRPIPCLSGCPDVARIAPPGGRPPHRPRREALAQRLCRGLLSGCSKAVSALEGRVPRVLITAQSSAMAGVERRLLQEAAVLRGLGATVLAAPARFPRSEQFRTALVQAGAELMDWQPYKFIERQQTGFPFPQWCSWASRAARRARLDLAHVAMPWTTVGLSRVWALQRAQVPVVLGLHCTYDRGRWPAQLLPYLQQALRGVVGMYAVSETVRLSFLDNFGPWVAPDDIEGHPERRRYEAVSLPGLSVNGMETSPGDTRGR